MNVEIYRRSDLLWGWRCRASNGKIVATDGSQGYVDRAECARMAKRVLNRPRLIRFD